MQRPPSQPFLILRSTADLYRHSPGSVMQFIRQQYQHYGTDWLPKYCLLMHIEPDAKLILEHLDRHIHNDIMQLRQNMQSLSITRPATRPPFIPHQVPLRQVAMRNAAFRAQAALPQNTLPPLPSYQPQHQQ